MLYASRNKAVLISSRFIIQIVHATGDNDRPIRSQSESRGRKKSRNRTYMDTGCNRMDINIKEEEEEVDNQ